MKTITDPQKIDYVLTRGVEAVYPTKEALAEALASGRRLRLYVGIDPTSPFLHIGHALQLKKLRQFQDLGHEIVLLIGSFTAMIGDPTDKLAARKQLTAKEVMTNAATYKKQASKILRFNGENPVKIMFNHKWLSKMNFADVVELASNFTVQQMMERDMFEKRLDEGKPIYLHEFFYPLMQGYDSVAMDVDLELGGSDQIFNMLAGRTLLKATKGKEKFVLALKLLTNDEGKKMSKSEGGFVALNDAPEEMYGKLMAMHDSMILPYFELITDLPREEIAGMALALKSGINPKELKMRLAHAVTAMFHSKKEADAAELHFTRVFSRHEQPEEMGELKVTEGMTVIDALMASGFVVSKSDARRLVDQGGVKLGDTVVADGELCVYGDALPLVLQKGKRHFIRLI